MKSISGITCYVKDLDTTAAFYELLGFRFGARDAKQLTIYLNWFWVKFLAQDQEADPELQTEIKLENKGAGLYINIKVESADSAYKTAVSKGLKTVGEPKDMPSGNREFVLCDPDGYKLIFFEKK